MSNCFHEIDLNLHERYNFSETATWTPINRSEGRVAMNIHSHKFAGESYGLQSMNSRVHIANKTDRAGAAYPTANQYPVHFLSSLF